MKSLLLVFSVLVLGSLAQAKVAIPTTQKVLWQALSNVSVSYAIQEKGELTSAQVQKSGEGTDLEFKILFKTINNESPSKTVCMFSVKMKLEIVKHGPITVGELSEPEIAPANCSM